MTTISSSAQAELYIGASTAATLPAPGSDTFTKVPQLKIVKPPQASKTASKEVTLDGVTVASSSIAQWSNCTGAFLTDYTQSTTHILMIGDAAITGRRRNWYIVEPDAGARRTDFVGEVIRCEGGDYEAQEDAPPARRHEFEIAVSGTPTVTP